jgi:hypothetical protein
MKYNFMCRLPRSWLIVGREPPPQSICLETIGAVQCPLCWTTVILNPPAETVAEADARTEWCSCAS